VLIGARGVVTIGSQQPVAAAQLDLTGISWVFLLELATPFGTFEGQHASLVGAHLGVADGGYDLVLADGADGRAGSQRRDGRERQRFKIRREQRVGELIEGEHLDRTALGRPHKAIVSVLVDQVAGCQRLGSPAVDVDEQRLQVAGVQPGQFLGQVLIPYLAGDAFDDLVVHPDSLAILLAIARSCPV